MQLPSKVLAAQADPVNLAEKAKLVLALDMQDGLKAVKLAESLQGLPLWMKVGLELFTAAGAGIIKDLKQAGFPVFLDLKFHDIPNTVAQAVKSVCQYDISMLTLHISGGRSMLEAAVNARDEVFFQSASKTAGKNAQGMGAEHPKVQKDKLLIGRPLLMGVTVLTSSSAEELGEDLQEIVLSRARLAKEVGLDGLVCSGEEVALVKKECGPDFLCLCPGIRFSGSAKDDQARVVSPDQAVERGADFLVMGRPLRNAEFPRAAAVKALSLMGYQNLR